MPNEGLESLIIHKINSGESYEQISHSLLKVGFKQDEIDKLIQQAQLNKISLHEHLNPLKQNVKQDNLHLQSENIFKILTEIVSKKQKAIIFSIFLIIINNLYLIFIYPKIMLLQYSLIFPINLIIMITLPLINVLIGLFFSANFLVISNQYNKSKTAKELFFESIKKFPSFVLIFILEMVLIFLSTIFILIVFFVISFINSYISFLNIFPWITYIGWLVYFALIIASVLYFLTFICLFSLSDCVLVSENLKGWKALAKSKGYVKKHLFLVAINLFLYSVITPFILSALLKFINPYLNIVMSFTIGIPLSSITRYAIFQVVKNNTSDFEPELSIRIGKKILKLV